MAINLDKKKIQELLDAGQTYAEIGEQFGVSRQRVHQIYKEYSSAPKRLEGLDYIREEIRLRDNYTCQFCFRQWTNTERRFDVHHLDERMESVKDYQYDRNNSDKMITLCHRCHLRLSFILKRTFEVMGITVPELPENPENPAI